jgi:Arm DNA-binding domain
LKTRFTDLTVKSLPLGKHFDTVTPAFGVRVGKNRRTWVVMRGKQRRLITLGHYPHLPISEARTKAKQLLAVTQIDHERVTFQQAYDLFVKIALPSRRPITAYEYQRIPALTGSPVRVLANTAQLSASTSAAYKFRRLRLTHRVKLPIHAPTYISRHHNMATFQSAYTGCSEIPVSNLHQIQSRTGAISSSSRDGRCLL